MNRSDENIRNSQIKLDKGKQKKNKMKMEIPNLWVDPFVISFFQSTKKSSCIKEPVV
jgi:hypothetical protein